MEIGGRMFAFIGLERTDPANASFVEMIVTDSDRAPEGMKAFFTDGKYYLAIVNEVSNTTSVYSINMAAVPEPETYAKRLRPPAARRGFRWRLCSARQMRMARTAHSRVHALSSPVRIIRRLVHPG
jgi:hypothetical protein